MENILLIKGWRRYNWPEMISATGDSMADPVTMGYKGFTGNTFLDPFSALLNNEGKMDITAYFNNQTSRVGKLLTDIALNITGQAKTVNAYLLKTLTTRKDTTTDHYQAPSFRPLVQSFTGTTVLNTVNVHATKLYNYIANDCGDYVCRFNVLDCITHRHEKDNTLPRLKNRYTVDDSTFLVNNPRVTIKQTFKDDKGKSIYIVAYNGCGSLKTDLELINADGLSDYRDFYPSDYSRITQAQTDYLSTIYWKHFLPVNSKKEAEVSFFTSDALGRFKIIVQGVTGKDVVYGEKTFVVTKQ